MTAGTGPAAPFVDASNAGTYSRPLDSEVGDGSFGFEMSAKPRGETAPKSLSVRYSPSTRRVSERGLDLRPRTRTAGFAAVGENRTSLRAEQLVSACRGRQ